jgi:rRNA maturation protein Nop10
MREFVCTDPNCGFVLTTQVKGKFEASHRHGKSRRKHQLKEKQQLAS